MLHLLTRPLPLNHTPPLDLAIYWNKITTIRGIKVYQRDDLIAPYKKDLTGRTNLQRMKAGHAPIGPDGQSVQLHHMTQRNQSSIVEVIQSFHQLNSKLIHINPNTWPSGINRIQYNNWKQNYWKNRAKDFQ
ncbi:HNH/ENDO VII family nuclease [Paenibacillus alkalitolerans]|uniref:HNH/ENDO VII family nuclease n=1 Tax=Paenibacillus alkalitolerans TaxID=2799335 RepID=UPI0038990776